jgi:serine/threonine protein kinase
MAAAPSSAKDLFLAALDQPTPAERAVFLDQACAANACLRQRVEALLRAHEQPESRLDQLAAVPLGATDNATQTLAVEASAAAVRNGDGGVTQAEPAGAEPVGAGDELKFLGPPCLAGALGRLDHYDVLEVIGKGGMGVVLKAKDTKLQRVVAIKALALQLAVSGTARKRFVREAQAAAAVRDEHVVAIHAVNDDGPVPYLVMDYICGVTLDERVKQGGALEIKEILRIGSQTACGLAAAHKQGLIHRDIKPGNILLENGVQRVKITDFGLARAADDASLTQSGVIAGTPMYMSPEQARGEPVDQRTDLFSLGSVLYTLAAGRPPFRADSTMGVLKRVCEDTPRPIREIIPEVPDWLCDVIGKLHAKKPDERFQTASEVADLLSQHLAHLQQPQLVPQPAAPPKEPAVLPSKRASSRRPRRRVLTAAGVLAAVGIATTYFVMRPPPPPSPDHGDALFAPAPARTPQELAKMSSPFDGRKREDIPRRLLALAGGGDPEQAAAELVAVFGDGRFKFTANPGWGLSPDGSVLIAAVGNDLHVFDARTGDLRTILRDQGGGFFFSDNKHIFTKPNDPIWRVLDIETGQHSQVMPRGAIPGSLMGVTPDGERVVASAADGTLLVWDKDFKNEPRVLRGPAPGVHNIVFSPDGKWIVQGCNDGNVRVRSTEKEEPAHLLKRFPQRVLGIAFSPDGKLLAAGTNNEFTVFDAVTFKEERTIRESAGFLRFTADGKSLWSAKHDHDPNELYTVAPMTWPPERNRRRFR